MSLNKKKKKRHMAYFVQLSIDVIASTTHTEIKAKNMHYV